MGMRKAAVFPEPVRAIATTSLPAMMRGMVRRWMGVGSLYPLRVTPVKTLRERPGRQQVNPGVHQLRLPERGEGLVPRAMALVS